MKRAPRIRIVAEGRSWVVQTRERIFLCFYTWLPSQFCSSREEAREAAEKLKVHLTEPDEYL